MHTNILLDIISHMTLFTIPGSVWICLGVSVFIVCSLLFYDRLYRYMEQSESSALRNLNNQLALILRAENTQVWTYNVSTRRYQRLDSEGTLESEYTPIDFSRFFDRNDFEEMRSEIFSIRDGKKEYVNIEMRSPKPEAGIKQNRYEIKITIHSRDEAGKPKILLGVQRDITNEEHRRERQREKLLNYQTVFNSPIMDMVYYDENGILTDINEMACKTFHIADKQTIINAHTHLNQVTYFDDLDIQKIEKTRCTSVIDLQKMEKEGRKGQGVELADRFYYEMMLYPIRDEQGELLGFFLQGRNATGMVEYYKTQRESTHELQKATEAIKAYIENINLALQTAECRIMNYVPDIHTLQIISDLNKPQHELSQIRAIDFIQKDYQPTARRLLNQLDHRSLKSINARLESILPADNEHNIWLTLNGIPMYDRTGRITHYFGMIRNDTKLVITEQQLKEETKKAQEAEALKNMFLLNMSYEIRTPLSTVIGFAALFDQEHEPEDEAIFVEEIKKNSNSLLTLVNDILYLSRIDAHMEEVNPQPTDFAITFDRHCHMGWSNNTNPNVKTIIDNPYEHLLLNIDEQMVGKVIELLIQNALFYIREGYVRAKYEYRTETLNIAIEDTGGGIPKEALVHIFDRFTDNQQEHLGSGLTLPITKGLVELMGGTIEMTSEVGSGTTVWVTIPCELISSEKKKNFI